MRNIASDLRNEALLELRALSPEERIALALDLGARDVELLRQARGLSVEEVEARFDRARRIGRRFCSFFEPDASK